MITMQIDRIKPHEVKIAITSSDVLPLEIFLYRHDIDGSDIYSTICRVEDIESYSIVLEPGVPFYRKNEVTKDFPSNVELEKFVDSAKIEINNLQNDYRIFIEKYGISETYTIN